MKKTLDKIPYLSLGIAMLVLANPFLYMFLAASMIDIQNLFGADLDRSSVAIDSNDPFIQAMNFVGLIGLILLIIGYFKRKVKHLF